MANLDIEKKIRRNIPGIPDCIKMSHLQNLLHDALISTGHVLQCAIVNCNDCLLSATSVGFRLQPDQCQKLVSAFKNLPQTRQDGIDFDGKKFTCVRCDSDSIYAKHNKQGLILVKTVALLLCATYNEHMFPSVCVEAVEKLADYFREKGK